MVDDYHLAAAIQPNLQRVVQRDRLVLFSRKKFIVKTITGIVDKKKKNSNYLVDKSTFLK